MKNTQLLQNDDQKEQLLTDIFSFLRDELARDDVNRTHAMLNILNIAIKLAQQGKLKTLLYFQAAGCIVYCIYRHRLDLVKRAITLYPESLELLASSKLFKNIFTERLSVEMLDFCLEIMPEASLTLMRANDFRACIDTVNDAKTLLFRRMLTHLSADIKALFRAGLVGGAFKSGDLAMIQTVRQLDEKRFDKSLARDGLAFFSVVARKRKWDVLTIIIEAMRADQIKDILTNPDTAMLLRRIAAHGQLALLLKMLGRINEKFDAEAFILTCIKGASSGGDEKTLTVMLDKLGDSVHPLRTKFLRWSLQQAIIKGHVVAVKALLAYFKKSMPEMKTEITNNEMFFSLAIKYPQLNMLKYLQSEKNFNTSMGLTDDKGLPISAVRLQYILRFDNRGGLLVNAIYRQRKAVIDYYLAEVDSELVLQKLSANQFSIFSFCAQRGNVEIFDALLATLVDDVSIKAMLSASEFLVFKQAVYFGRLSIVKRLLELIDQYFNFDSEMAASKKNYHVVYDKALLLAIREGHTKTLVTLLEHYPGNVTALLNGEENVLYKQVSNYSIFFFLLEQVEKPSIKKIVKVAENLQVLRQFPQFDMAEKLMTFAKAYGIEQEILLANNYSLFEKLCIYADVYHLGQWLEVAKTNNCLQQLLESKGKPLISRAISDGNIEVVRLLLNAYSPNERYNLLLDNFDFFNTASNQGHMSLLKLLLSEIEPADRQMILLTHNRQILTSAAAKNRLAVMQYYLKQFNDVSEYINVNLIVQVMAHQGCMGYKLDGVEYLLNLLQKVQRVALLKKNNFAVLKRILIHGGHSSVELFSRLSQGFTCDVVSTLESENIRYFPHYFSQFKSLFRYSTVYAYIEMHYSEGVHLRSYVNKISQKYLSKLDDEIKCFRDDKPYAVFDLKCSDDSIDAERALYAYFIFRHLIRRCQDDDIDDELRSKIYQQVELLLNIPVVKRLVIANATSTELPEDYQHPNRQMGQRSNELLRLAQSVGDEYISARLLAIPQIFDEAERCDFYQGGSGLSLAEVAADNESSMHSLTPEEKKRLGDLEQHYKIALKKQGKTKIISALKSRLESYFLSSDREDKRCICIDDRNYLLPFSWDELQQLIKGEKFNDTQIQAVMQVYYKNPYHSAYRYLSKPNHWMAKDALWVNSDQNNDERWSTFDEHTGLIALLYLACCDETHPPVDSKLTVSDRIELFILQLAYIGRAHNWDVVRICKDVGGNVIYDNKDKVKHENYDDLKGDKPSCLSGVKLRLFQSLLEHPLYQLLTRSIIVQFIRERVRESYREYFLQTKVETLIALQKDAENCLLDDASVSMALEDLEQSDDFINKIQQEIVATFGERGRVYCHLVKKVTMPLGKANVFLNQYHDAGLATLLDQIMRSKFKQLLQQQVQDLAFNLLSSITCPDNVREAIAASGILATVSEHGIGAVWPQIQDKIEQQTRMLAKENDIEINNEQLSDFLSECAQLSLENIEYLREKLSQSKGYQAFLSQQLKAHSRCRFFLPIDHSPIIDTRVNVNLQHAILV